MRSYLTKYFGYKRGIQFNKIPLFPKRKGCPAKIVNAYLVYDLDAWSKVSLRDFKTAFLVQLIYEKVMIKVRMCTVPIQ